MGEYDEKRAQRLAVAMDILGDLERTSGVVTAAVLALEILEGPNPTSDGDDPAMGARTALRAAIFDHANLAKGVDEILGRNR